MDKSLFATWLIFVIFALCVDVGAYIALRVVWKRKGVVLTDQFWELMEGHLSRAINAVIAWFRRILPPLPNLSSLSQASTPDQPQPASTPAEEAQAEVQTEEVQTEVPAGVELVPFYVQTIGTIRQVQFSLEMPLNTTVNLRIGATGEDGIKVEKREL